MISSQHHFLKPLIRNNRKVHSHSNNSWTTHHACPRSCRNAEGNWIWLLLSRLPCEWGGSDTHCLRPQSSGHYFLQPSRELLRQRVWEKKQRRQKGERVADSDLRVWIQSFPLPRTVRAVPLSQIWHHVLMRTQQTTYPAQRFLKDQLYLMSFMAEKAQLRRTFTSPFLLCAVGCICICKQRPAVT